MIIVDQSWEWVKKPDNPLQLIELAGRTCYKSEDRITPDSAAKFVKRILESGHHSVIEHANATIKFITNRGITHELVRHRIAAYSQESSRYCNYGSDHIKFIRPVWSENLKPGIYRKSFMSEYELDECELAWLNAMLYTEEIYKGLLSNGWHPEQAREVLPNSLKTEIVMTANLREWLHVFKLRISKAAHPQIRELMLSCLDGFQKEIPVLFDTVGI